MTIQSKFMDALDTWASDPGHSSDNALMRAYVDARKTSVMVPSPVAGYGHTVAVLNYRRTPAAWELGTVEGLSYENNFGGEFSWSYRVRLARVSSNGNPIFLHIGNDGLGPTTCAAPDAKN